MKALELLLEFIPGQFPGGRCSECCLAWWTCSVHSFIKEGPCNSGMGGYYKLALAEYKEVGNGSSS